MNKSAIKLLSRKFITSVIISSTFTTGCTMVVIWFHLSDTDRSDIFFDIVSLSLAIGVTFVFIIVSFSGFSLVIFISFFILVLTYALHEDNFENYSSIPHRILTVCYLSNLFIYCSMIVGYYTYYPYGQNSYSMGITGFVLMLALSYFVSYFSLFKAKRFGWYRSDSYEKLPVEPELLCFLPLQFMIPGIVRILPILFLPTQFDFSEGTNGLVEVLMLLALTAAIVTIGILSDAIYLNEHRSGDKFTGFIVVLTYIPVVITVFGMWYRPIPNMITSMVMSLSGISDWRTHWYYIENKTHSCNMFNSLIWDTRYYTEIPERFFITGVSTSTLGDIKLVRPAEATEVRKESLRFTINGIGEYEQKGKQLRAVAMKCIPFNKNDIHTWGSPLSEPIYYGKVEQTIDNSVLKILYTPKRGNVLGKLH